MTPLQTFQSTYPDLDITELLSKPGIISQSSDHLFFLHDRNTGYQWGLMAFFPPPTEQKILDAFTDVLNQIPLERRSQPISGILRSNCPMARTYEDAIDLIPSVYSQVFGVNLIQGSGQNIILHLGRSVRLGSLFLRTPIQFLGGEFVSV